MTIFLFLRYNCNGNRDKTEHKKLLDGYIHKPNKGPFMSKSERISSFVKLSSLTEQIQISPKS